MLDVKDYPALRLIDGVLLLHRPSGKCVNLVRDYAPEIEHQFIRATEADAETYVEKLYGSVWERALPRPVRHISKARKALREAA